MRVDHIGIAVKNLEEVIEKFNKIYPHLEATTENSENGDMKISFLKFDNIEIELIESIKENSIINKFISKHGEGIHHIALEVCNIQESIVKLSDSNIKLINRIPKKGSKDRLITFLHPKDFNGVLLELCQRINSKDK